MQSKASIRHLRIAPRKVRLVAETIRGRKVGEAQAILRMTTKSGAAHLQKTLQSALASAKNNFALAEDNLYVAKIRVDEGPKLKRYRARARGRAYPIEKKTSHITLVLDELVPGAAHAKPAEKQETPEAKTEPHASSEHPKWRPQREIRKAAKTGGLRKMFRRKAI